jgi:hypothetical protein
MAVRSNPEAPFTAFAIPNDSNRNNPLSDVRYHSIESKMQIQQDIFAASRLYIPAVCVYVPPYKSTLELYWNIL